MILAHLVAETKEHKYKIKISHNGQFYIPLYVYK